MPILEVSTTQGKSEVWRRADVFPVGTVVSAHTSGRLYLVTHNPYMPPGAYSRRGLLRLDDGSFQSYAAEEYVGLLFREVKGKLTVEV